VTMIVPLSFDSGEMSQVADPFGEQFHVRGLVHASFCFLRRRQRLRGRHAISHTL